MSKIILKQLNILKESLNCKADKKDVCTLMLFLIFNTLKVSIFNYVIIAEQTPQVFMYKFVMTLMVGIIIYSVIFRIKSRIVFLTVYIMQTIYLLVNLSYNLYFHSYIHFLQWMALLGEAAISSWHSANPKSPLLIIVCIDLPIFIYIVVKYARIFASGVKLRFFTGVAFILSLLVLSGMEISNYYQGCSLSQLAVDRCRGESYVVERYGTIANNVMILVMKKNEEELISSLKYGNGLNSTGETGEKPNFIIIQVESMDSNVVSQKYKDSYIAPFLHSLVGKSIYYPYVLSYHEGGGTSDSEFSIINSVEPLEYYPAMKLMNYNYQNSMLTRLSKASYGTFAFHGNLGNFYNRDTAFPRMGFTDFFDINRMKLNENGWGIPDGDVFNFAASKLKKQAQPYLAYIITMTSHGPFNSASNYYKNNRYDDITDETVKNYFNSMSYVDQSLEELVTSVKSSSDNTYILIFGDHTPNINTGLYKQAAFSQDARYFEFVPLFIIAPGGKAYSEDRKVASFLDIAPTILNASGVKFEINTDGQDLINRDTWDKSIPFKGGSYRRTYLFDKITGSGD